MRISLLVSGCVTEALGLATCWAGAGDTVTVVLLDSAAAAARRGHGAGAALAEATRAGIVLAVQDEALARVAVRSEDRSDDVKVMDLGEIADLVAEQSDRVLWR